MKEHEKLNQEFLDYIVENIKTIIKCDFEEGVYDFPCTRCFNTIFQKLKKEYNINFNPELISDELLDKILEEVL